MKIVDVLNEQIGLLKEMSMLLKKEVSFLSNGETDKFVVIVKEKEELSARLTIVESKRQSLLGSKTLAAFLYENPDYQHLQLEYKDTIKLINELNEQVLLMMKMEESLLSETINLIAKEATGKAQTYGEKGAYGSSSVVESTILNKTV